jgi:ferritin-like metal-binding protein YciE
MAARAQDVLTRHMGEVHGLESAIVQALDEQLTRLPEYPDVQDRVRVHRETLAQHVETTRHRLGELGADVEPFLQGLRGDLGEHLTDHYIALSRCVITYQALHTAALAAGDQKTAEIARRHLRDTTHFAIEINQLLPKLLLEDLRRNGVPVSDGALARAQKTVREIWQ